MAASYKKLFKLLIDRDMKKKELAEKAGISIATITKMGKDGVNGCVATINQFKDTKKHIDSLLIEIAKELSGGKIAAMPYQKGAETPCDFCSYKEICRRDKNAPFVEHESFSDKAFFEKVKGSDDNG